MRGSISFLVPPVVALALSVSSTVSARTFSAEGADAVAGLGARQIAMGGTGVASSRGSYAVYYGAAGLSDTQGVEFTYDRELGAIKPVSFLGLAVPTDFGRQIGLKTHFGLGYYPRIYAKATGAFNEDDFESIFLRYLLPGLDGNFDGELLSKTKVYRLAGSVAPADNGHWSLGANVDYIDCKTDFCGSTGSSVGQTVAATEAKAISFGVSGRYQLSDKLLLAAAVSDIGSDLSTRVVISDDNGTRSARYNVAFPLKVLLGAQYQYSDALLLATDFDWMLGDYGSNTLDVRIFRAGLEYQSGTQFVYRAGVIAPLLIESETEANLDLPFPFAPTLGLGWSGEDWSVDAALYPHPLESAHTGQPEFRLNLGVTLRF